MQARRILHLCTAILLDSMSSHNCLAIYGAAAGCNCTEVAEAARSFGLRHFTKAAQLDYGGLTRLPAAHLLSFLCSDDLQVGAGLGWAGLGWAPVFGCYVAVLLRLLVGRGQGSPCWLSGCSPSAAGRLCCWLRPC